MSQFARRVVAVSLALTVVLAVMGAIYSLALAKGLLLGGVSASLVFLLWARFASGIMSGNTPMASAMIGLPFIRLAVYALVLWKAYTFDTAGLKGFIGATIGLSIVYLVTAVVGYLGSPGGKK